MSAALAANKWRITIYICPLQSMC